MCSVKLLYQTVRYRTDEPFLGSIAEFEKATIILVMSAWNNSTPTGQIFMKVDI
jgi:hypothetical protein